MVNEIVDRPLLHRKASSGTEKSGGSRIAESAENGQWRNFEPVPSMTHGSGKPSVLQRHVWKRVARDKVPFLEVKSVLLDSAFDTINPRTKVCAKV